MMRRPRCKHGMTGTPEFRAYHEMKKRCFNPKNKEYRNYGGRGITVCARWLHPKEGANNFIADMGPRPSKDHSIDRIDPNGNYEPSNCRWATTREQRNNRRITLKDNDGTPLTDIAERTGINYYTIFSRFQNGDRGEALIRRTKFQGKRTASSRWEYRQ